MAPYRSTPSQDDDTLLFKPRRRWGLGVAITAMVAFSALCVVCLVAAFGAGALISVPSIGGMTLMFIWRARRNNDPECIAAYRARSELQADEWLRHPGTGCPKNNGNHG